MIDLGVGNDIFCLVVMGMLNGIVVGGVGIDIVMIEFVGNCSFGVELSGFEMFVIEGMGMLLLIGMCGYDCVILVIDLVVVVGVLFIVLLL